MRRTSGSTIRKKMIPRAFTVRTPEAELPHRILTQFGLTAVTVNEFLEQLEICGRSSYTLHSYAIGLADFLGWLRRADTNIDDVTRHVAGRYIAEFGNAPKGGIVAAAGKGGSAPQPRTGNHPLSVLAFDFAF